MYAASEVSESSEASPKDSMPSFPALLPGFPWSSLRFHLKFPWAFMPWAFIPRMVLELANSAWPYRLDLARMARCRFPRCRFLQNAVSSRRPTNGTSSHREGQRVLMITGFPLPSDVPLT